MRKALSDPLTIWKLTLPVWGWLLIALLIFYGVSAPSRQRDAARQQAYEAAQQAEYQRRADAKVAARAQAQADEATRRQRLAGEVLSLGANPGRLEPAESSVEGSRHYYTWDRPDLGGQVTSIWIAPDNWWVKISDVRFNYHDLGTIQNGTFIDGALKGNIQASRIPDKVLHIMTPKWAASVGAGP